LRRGRGPDLLVLIRGSDKTTSLYHDAQNQSLIAACGRVRWRKAYHRCDREMGGGSS
jgi:hypothetical protein